MTYLKLTVTLISTFVLLISGCSKIEDTRNDLEDRAQVFTEDAFSALTMANGLSEKNRELHNRSLAQIVFPKAIKGGLIIGGSYAEGYLIQDGKVLKEIRMVGGNIGPNIGGQSYSQITYVLEEETLSVISEGQKFSLQGTASYAKSGKSITDIFGQISDGQSLVTIIFNESGYLAGISFEGTYIAAKI